MKNSHQIIISKATNEKQKPRITAPSYTQKMTSKTRSRKIRAKLPYFPNQVKEKNEREMIGYSTPRRPTPLLQFYKAISSIYDENSAC